MLKSKVFIGIFTIAFILMSSVISFGATISYQYDDLHRLKRIENHSNGTITVYSYDEVGNRTRKIVTTLGSPPIAEFSATPRNGSPPLTVNFIDQSVGNITSWLWDFGDGETSSLQNPSHTYQNVGNYTVSLTVDGPNGSNTHTKVNYITVTNPLSCTYWISPTWQFFEASGGSDHVDLSASSSDCPWTAISNVPWITITSESSGTGNGDVYYSVAPNLDPSQRDGTITIADKTFAITQAAGGCAYSILPLSKSFDSTGGTDSVAVTVASGCEWTATSNDSWITITSGGIGTGNGTVNYFVEQNIDANPRTGTITIADKTFTVNQNVSEAGSSIQLPKTGQTKCYDLFGTEISCTGTGQDGEDQAGVVWPIPRFTINGDCVTDNLTGLMWAKSPDSTKRTWYEAINYANNLTLCGYPDWHLPNVNELESLINADEPSTAAWLNIQGFNNIQSNNYWTSTTFFTAPDTSTSWCVHMTGGQMDKGTKSWDYNYVWPVHSLSDSGYPASIWQTGQKTSYAAGDDGDLQIGIAWPSPRFEDNGNGIVTDNLTNLMWLKDANCIKTIYSSFDNDWTSGDGEVSWQHALDFVQGINDGTYSNCGSGYTDWRLPNRKELRSLMDYSKLDPALPSDHTFTNVQSGYYWTPTTGAGSASYAWMVRMVDIDVGSGGKEEGGHFVWPVRSGTEQCQSETETLATGLTGINELALDETSVYWVENGSCYPCGAVKKISKGGGSVTTLASGLGGATGLAIDSTYVYFSDDRGNPNATIKRVPKNGGSITTLASGQPSASKVTIDSSSVYWTTADGGTVRKVSKNGGTVTILATGSNTPLGIAVDSANVYWSEFTNPGSVWKVPVNGGETIKLADNSNTPGIAIDSNFVYWTETVVPNGKVNKVPINGGSVIPLATGLNKPWDVAIDSTDAYWIENNSNGAVKKVSLAGGTVTILASGLNSPEAIAIDDTHVYWIERGSGTLKRVTKECTPPDTTPPNLSITSHSDGQHVSTSTITLAGTASDSGQGDNGIQQVTVNGSRANNDTATGSETANWNKALSLSVGPNPITVIAYDNSSNHNQTSQTITIYYDVPGVPDISVSVTSLNLGQVLIGDSSMQTVTISNTGTANLVISFIGTTGGDAGMFIVAMGGTNPCPSLNPTITPGSNCTITVTFSPTSVGPKSTNMRINSDDPDTPTLNLTLSGTGIVHAVTCNFTPGGTTLIRGGILRFWASASNDSDMSQTFQFATFVTLPNGHRHPTAGWLFGPIPVTLGPHTSKSKSLTQFIPYNAPFGTYTYHGYVGTVSPPLLYNQCQFTFKVVQ